MQLSLGYVVLKHHAVLHPPSSFSIYYSAQPDSHLPFHLGFVDFCCGTNHVN